MKSKLVGSIVKVLFIIIAFQEIASAENLKSSLGYIESFSGFTDSGVPSGLFVELVKAIDDVYIQGDISIDIYPFARSLKNVQLGKADFHLPLIKSPHISLSKLPYRYATECIAQVTFILYTSAKSPPININNIEQYTIETLRGHKVFFPFDIIESNNVEQGIHKLIKGRTDGYIMAQDSVDEYIKKHKIKNIRRTFYETWESCVVIKKGSQSKKIDSIISQKLRELKKTGRLYKIITDINHPFDDWQPFEMPW